MKKTQKFKVPNALITNASLSLTARKVGAVIYAYRSAQGVCSKSMRELGALAGLATGTVLKAVQELTDAGVLQVKRTYHFDKNKHRLVRDRNTYICDLSFQGGYTLVPYSMLQRRDLSASAFIFCLYIYRTIGCSTRAYPSINHIAASIGIAKSTACRALRVLKNLPEFLVQCCRKVSGAFSSNSFFTVSAYDTKQIPQDAARENRFCRASSLRAFILRAAEWFCKPFQACRVVRNLIQQTVTR